MSPSTSTFRAAYRRSAAGMTLIEVCSVMAANAVLVAVILSALFSLGRADRTHSTRLEKLRGVSELSARLREDLHAAQSLAWDEAGGVLRLTTPDDVTVVYTRGEDRWERRTTSPAAAAAAEAKENDESDSGELTAAFRVPNQLNVTITPAAANVGEQIHVVWRAEHDADRNRPTLLTPPELSVTLGRDQKVLHE